MQAENVEYIVIHCSDTPESMDIGAAEIKRWHTDPKPLGGGRYLYKGKNYESVADLPKEVRMGQRRGNAWSAIGYHAIIRRNGQIETTEEGCRPLNRQGAHVRGFNRKSIGICLVGGMMKVRTGNSVKHVPSDNFTEEQRQTLARILPNLLEKFPNATVVGHNDLNPHKSCPCFDVSDFIEALESGGVGVA